MFLTDAAAYDYGVSFAHILLCTSFLFGVFYVLINALQARGAATESLIVSISRQGLIYIPAMFILGAIFHETGLIWAQPVADVLSLLLTLVLYMRNSKKVDWQEIKKSLCRHPNRASTEALSYDLKKLLYIVFAIRHPRRIFQQLLRRDFIELCKGNQIGDVEVAEAVLLRGNGLAADTQRFRHKLLRHLAADAVFLQCLAQKFGDSLLSLPHLLGINILFECLYEQNMETWKEKNLCWHRA